MSRLFKLFSIKAKPALFSFALVSRITVRLVLYMAMIGSLLWSTPPVWSKQEPLEGRGTVRMSVVAVNPSGTKTQKVPVKTYLPIEVTPKDIINSGGLKMEFDEESSAYYLYSDDVELKPKEMSVFQVELRDVWVILKERLDTLRSQMEAILKRMKGTADYELAQKLGEAIHKALDTVEKTQNDETVSTKRHMRIYRNNLKIIDQIKEDISRLEKQAGISENKPVPEPVRESVPEPAKAPASKSAPEPFSGPTSEPVLKPAPELTPEAAHDVPPSR